MEQKENRVVLRGTVAGEAVLSHQVHGIDFYRFPLAAVSYTHLTLPTNSLV